MQQQILGTVNTSVNGTSLSAAGVSLTKDGQVSFDQNTFLTAYAADPAKITGLFRPGGSERAAIPP